MNTPPEIIKSSSQKYSIKIQVNDNKTDRTKYKCLAVTLYDSSLHRIDTFQTGASDYSKWALKWMPDKDTLVLNSSDIGIYAYRVNSNGKLEEVALTKEIDEFADKIFKLKYKEH
jgi:hypothetical protein